MDKRIAKITSTELGFHDRGFFTSVLYVDFGGASQGIGLYALGMAPDKKDGAPYPTKACAEFIMRVILACGVSEWSELKGRTIYVLYAGPGEERPIGIENLPTEPGQQFLFGPWQERARAEGRTRAPSQADDRSRAVAPRLEARQVSAFPDHPVTAFLEHRAPPHWVIERARQTAVKSPCAKSKRGAAIFYPETERNRINGLGTDPLLTHPDYPEFVFGAVANNIVTGDGFNGPPDPFACDGSALCKQSCKYTCLHAEERAIVEAAALDDLTECELVHVKVVDGVVVPGGGPSCWQCSRKVLEHKLAGVWLYEKFPLKNMLDRPPGPGVITARDGVEDVHAMAEWVFYTALEFHKATLKECKLGEYARPGTDTR